MSLLPSDPISQAKDIAAAAIVVIVLCIMGYLAYTKSRLETQLAQAQTLIAQVQGVNMDWKTKAEQANTALERTIQQGNIRAAEAAKAVKSAQQQTAAYASRAKQIMATKAGANDCLSAKKLTDSYFGAKQ